MKNFYGTKRTLLVLYLLLSCILYGRKGHQNGKIVGKDMPPTSRQRDPVHLSVSQHGNFRDQDGFLSLREFRSALASSGARLTLAEIRALFTHLETAELATERVLSSGRDGNDMAPWRGLLEEIRPALSGENLGLVRLAFRRMDCRGEGSVPPRMLTERYATSCRSLLATVKVFFTASSILLVSLCVFSSRSFGVAGFVNLLECPPTASDIKVR